MLRDREISKLLAEAKGRGCVSNTRFDRWSSTYDDSWMQRLYFDRIHAAVLSLAAEGSRPGVVLDVGCGTGRLLRDAGTQWPNATLIGVDPAPGMIAEAKKRLASATFHIAPAEDLPLADATVDLAVSTISFHHWPKKREGLEEIARVLRPGGRLLLADHAVPQWFSSLGLSQALAPTAASELVTKAGLSVKRVVTLRFHVWSVEGYKS